MMRWTWRSEGDAKAAIKAMNNHQPDTLSKRIGSPISIARGAIPASEQYPPSPLNTDSKFNNEHSSEAEYEDVSGGTYQSRILGSSRARNLDPLSPALSVETQQGRRWTSLARNYKRDEFDSDDEDQSDDESDDESDKDETGPAGALEEVVSGSTATSLATPSLETANPTAENLKVASATDSQSNTQPSLRHHPEHLAILISGVIIVVICLLSVLTCLLIRRMKKRNRESTSSPYGHLRQHYLRWPGTKVVDSEKRPSSSQESPEPQKLPAWDPASSFARPLSKLPKRPGPAVRRMFNPLGSHPLSAQDSSPSGDGEPKSSRPTTESSVKNMMNNVIQIAPQGPPTPRTRSSAALPSGQQPSPPSRSIPTPRTPRFISNFSFSTTPRSSGTTSSTWGNGMRPSYISRTSDNDRGTVYTSDSEPPRFRSVTSWVVHQQNKSLKKQQSPSLESAEPPQIAKQGESDVRSEYR